MVELSVAFSDSPVKGTSSQAVTSGIAAAGSGSIA
jgi:hypothetical protein